MKGTLAHAGGYRVLVTGGRDYDDREAVFRALDRLHRLRGVLVVIHGACDEDDGTGKRRLRGADRWADEWADSRGVPKIRDPVTKDEWRTHRGAAGPMRNERMIVRHLPDIAAHFPGGAGTADCLRRCYEHGVLRWNPLTNEVT